MFNLINIFLDAIVHRYWYITEV